MSQAQRSQSCDPWERASGPLCGWGICRAGNSAIGQSGWAAPKPGLPRGFWKLFILLLEPKAISLVTLSEVSPLVGHALQTGGRVPAQGTRAQSGP